MTRWFQRFLHHTFTGHQLMTEDVLTAIREDLRQTRIELAEVLQEITLVLQALDIMDLRCQRTTRLPPGAAHAPEEAYQLGRAPQPQPTELNNAQRQREVS